MTSLQQWRKLIAVVLFLGCAAHRTQVVNSNERSQTPAPTAGNPNAASFRLGTAVVAVDLPPTWQVQSSAPDHLILAKVATPGKDLNPTLEVIVEPRREQYNAQALVEQQAQRGLGHMGAPINVPTDWRDAELGSNGLAGSGTLKVAGHQYPVRWHYFDASTDTQHFVIASLCSQTGALACEQEFAQMVQSFEKSAVGVKRKP